MTSVNYDMQKLNEAVSALTSDEPFRERLRDAHMPLLTLHTGGGMRNLERRAELDSIMERLANGGADRLPDEDARQVARDIVALCSGNWHDTVFRLDAELAAAGGARRGMHRG